MEKVEFDKYYDKINLLQDDICVAQDNMIKELTELVDRFGPIMTDPGDELYLPVTQEGTGYEEISIIEVLDGELAFTSADDMVYFISEVPYTFIIRLVNETMYYIKTHLCEICQDD